MNDKFVSNNHNAYQDFQTGILTTTPLEFFNSHQNNEPVNYFATSDSAQPQQMIFDFFINSTQSNSNSNNNNNNNNNKTANDYITEADIQDILSNKDISLINSKISYSSDKTDYLKSHPLPVISQNDFNVYYNSFDSNDITNLEQQISKLSSNTDLKQTIGPFCALDQLIELSYKADPELYNEMIEKRQCMEKYIYKWRKVRGDGNCFYRAIIFSFIENIILNNNQQLMINLIMDIKKCYENKVILSKLNIKEGYTIKYNTMLKILIIIYNNLKNNNRNKAYEIYVKCIVDCLHFDYGLILYLRYLLYIYTIENENKLYTENFPVLIGNLLPSEYETEEGKFLFQNYYENYLLRMFRDAEKIVIYLLPFVLCTKLNVVLFDVNTDSLKEFNYYGKDNCESNYCINIVNVRVHYELIYLKEFYDLFRDYYDNYQLNKKYVNAVLPMKIEDAGVDDHIHSSRNKEIQNSSHSNSTNLLEIDFDNLPIQNQCKTERTNNNISQVINNLNNIDYPYQYNLEKNQTNAISESQYNKPKYSKAESFDNTRNQQNIYPKYEEIYHSMNSEVNNKPLEKLSFNRNSMEHNQNILASASLFDFFANANKEKQNLMTSSNNSNSNSNSNSIKQKEIPTTTIDKSPNNYYQSISEEELAKCSNCNSSYLDQNQFKLCSQCLINEIKTNLLTLYYTYLNNSKELALRTKNSSKSKEIFKSTFVNRSITIKGNFIKIEDALAVVNKKRQERLSVNELLNQLKSTLCANCESDIQGSKCSIPCGCCFCSIKCELQYLENFQMIVNTHTQHMKHFICVCNHLYSPQELLTFISHISVYCKPKAEIFFALFKKQSKNLCLFCERAIIIDKGIFQIDCENMPIDIEQQLGIKTIKHSICYQCFQQAKKDPNPSIYCSICGIMHIAKKKDCNVF